MDVAFLKFLLSDSVLLGSNGISVTANNNENTMIPFLKVTVSVFSKQLLTLALHQGIQPKTISRIILT